MKFKDTIGVFPNAFTLKECNEIKNLFDKKIDLKEAVAGYSSSGQDNKMKKSTDYNLYNDTSHEGITLRDKIISRFNDTLSDKYLSKFPHNSEFSHGSIIEGKCHYPALNLQKYDKSVGHYNAWHCEKDHFGTAPRQFVFILYLNDVPKGGETQFLFKEEGSQDYFSIKPEVGKMIIHPASWPYIHKGAMPVSNDKYIATTWLQYGDW